MLTDFEEALRQLIKGAVREVVREELQAVRTAGQRDQLDAADLNRYVTYSEASKIASVSRTTLRRWAVEGHLRTFKTGRTTRIRTGDLHACMERGTAPVHEKSIEEMARDLLAKAASSCAACRHLPKMHRFGSGPCRAKKCTCQAMVPPTRS